MLWISYKIFRKYFSLKKKKQQTLIAFMPIFHMVQQHRNVHISLQWFFFKQGLLMPSLWTLI